MINGEIAVRVQHLIQEWNILDANHCKNEPVHEISNRLATSLISYYFS